MRPKGKLFDGSGSLYATQQGLVKNNIAGQALWLTHFTPARWDHLGFVNRLLKTFCELDRTLQVHMYRGILCDHRRGHCKIGNDKEDWWCDLCNKPLFKTTKYVFC